jgi:hypothetical protein
MNIAALHEAEPDKHSASPIVPRSDVSPRRNLSHSIVSRSLDAISSALSSWPFLERARTTDALPRYGTDPDTGQGAGGEQVVGLPFGTYEIRASVTDSDGNIVTHVRNITVIRIPDSNLPPTVTIVFPTEGMELLAGIPTPLQATASDPEEGDVSQNIAWANEDGTLIAFGPSVSVSLTAGQQRILAFARDSHGASSHKGVNVNVLPDPNYCTTGGTLPANTYWINRVKLNEVVQTSASDGGYGDFTGTWIKAVKGNNLIQATAANGRVVYWTVWIDLNRDGVFSANEALVNTRGSGFNQTLRIPSTAITGVTRMRVAMRYPQPPPACGVGYPGETEDYTVIIQ